jgi:hypothetical protein
MDKNKPARIAPNDRAPRPHAVTVGLSIGAMLISLLSLWVACHSGKIASDSLRISQQAYLSVRTNILTVRGMRTIPSKPGGSKPADNSPPIVTNDKIDLRQAQGDLAIACEFEIENSGNTPAIPDELTLTFKMPRGWELIVPWTSHGVRLTKGSNSVSVIMESVNPKKSVQKAVLIGLHLTEEARMEFLEKRAQTSIGGLAVADIRGPVELHGWLPYRDEIGHRDPLNWCKAVQMNLPTPLDCIPGAIGVFDLR